MDATGITTPWLFYLSLRFIPICVSISFVRCAAIRYRIGGMLPTAL